jgi:hypothetical protein
MLASINPLVERSRGSRFVVTFVAYLLGSVAGGAALGGLLGLAGAGLHALVPWSGYAGALAVVAICAVGFALDAVRTRFPVPTVRRQVNENWLAEYRGWVYGLGFGFQLGLGLVTIVTTATVYVTFALALLAGWPGGLVVGITFGLVRALPLLLVVRVREPGQLRRMVRRTHGWAPHVQQAALASLLVVGTVGAVLAWR